MSLLHQISVGETLGGIAKRYGVSLSAVQAANPQIKNVNLIFAGQRLNIPRGPGSFGSVGNALGASGALGGVGGTVGTTNLSSQTKVYTVAAGDTLSSIAQRHGVSLGELKAANPQILDANRIYIGDQIIIPRSGNSQASPAKSAPRGTVPKWLEIARAELGSNDQARYGLSSGHWCSAFVRWVMEQAGFNIAGTTPLAKSWLTWSGGYRLDQPRVGAIMVETDGGAGTSNYWPHVCFCDKIIASTKMGHATSHDGQRVITNVSVIRLGGNQAGGKVTQELRTYDSNHSRFGVRMIWPRGM